MEGALGEGNEKIKRRERSGKRKGRGFRNVCALERTF